MSKDTTIEVPTVDTSETGDIDNTTVSVHVFREDGWVEERLAPGQTMDIQMPDGTQIAIIDLDEDN